MIWKKYSIKTNSEVTDIVASVLFDNGIVGAEICDNKNLSKEELSLMYVDIPLENKDDGIAYVNFYVTLSDNNKEKFNNIENIDDNALVDNSYMMSNDNIYTKDEFDGILKNIMDELNSYKNFCKMGDLTINVTDMDDEVFLNKWKENFKVLEFDDIRVIPSFNNDEYKNDDKMNIYIEPGNAFGTGQHATTKLCIRAIKNVVGSFDNLKNKSLLDVGCGSGILAIVSYMLGIKDVTAIDIDKNVELNLKTNIELNNIDVNNDNGIKTKFGNIICDDDFRLNFGKYDIVVANILAPVIISLIDKGCVDKFIKDGGYFICSGIIENSLDDVLKTIIKVNKYEIISKNNIDEWYCLVLKLNGEI